MDKVSFVNKISTLMKATSDDSKPIQGYLYQEINKITFESDGYRESTLEFLVDRLNKQSCHVKFKVLKILKYIVENGPPEFRLGLLKCSQGIREATKFSGPEDPIHGNIPNKAVRQIAQELSQLLFDTEEARSPEKMEQKPEPDKSRIVGYGNTNVSPKGSLQGFGNSPVKTKNSFMDKLRSWTTSSQDRKKEQQAAILASIEFRGDYTPPPLPVFISDEPKQETEKEVVKKQEVKPVKHIPGKVGGGWDDDEEEEGTEEGSKTTNTSSHDREQVVEGVDFITDDWHGENNLVQTTLNRSDDTLLSTPEIKEFLSSCQNLNCERIVILLNDQLKSSSQAIVMKTLLLLEYFMDTDLVNCDYICKTCQQHLFHLSKGESSMSTVKAKKILLIFEKLLGVNLLSTDILETDGQYLLMED